MSKTIKVKDETYNTLASLGTVTESFDDVINKTLAKAGVIAVESVEKEEA